MSKKYIPENRNYQPRRGKPASKRAVIGGELSAGRVNRGETSSDGIWSVPMPHDGPYPSHKSTATSSHSFCPKSSYVSSTGQHSQLIWSPNMSAKISNKLRCALRTLWGSRRGLPKVSFQRWSHAASILLRAEGVIKTLAYFSRNNAIASILQLVAEWPCCLHALQTILGSHT